MLSAHSACVICLDNGCDRYGCRAPAYGLDLWKHFYRGGNERADDLTWETRDKPGVSRNHAERHDLNYGGKTLTAVGGSFDGDFSSIGAGGG
eukprot:6731462-Pyramimonas_sp.AAC.1